MFKNLKANNLHHAYLIEGEYDQVLPDLLLFLTENKLISNHTDAYQNSTETLNIDLSRALKATQAEKAPHKFFILGAKFFGHEAVNSLLKVFEEPTLGTHFFLITPNPHLLPATLKSRFYILSPDKKDISPAVRAEAERFLYANPTMRIKMIGEFLGKFEDLEKDENNMKSSAQNWLNGIETVLYKSADLKKNVFEFEELAKARDYLADRGASTKILLEHLALILPAIK